MASTLSSARHALNALGPRGQRTRIPESVRGVVLAYVSEAQRTEETWAACVISASSWIPAYAAKCQEDKVP